MAVSKESNHFEGGSLRCKVENEQESTINDRFLTKKGDHEEWQMSHHYLPFLSLLTTDDLPEWSFKISNSFWII